jgi:uncharacterized protein YbaR (Trm112 family)
MQNKYSELMEILVCPDSLQELCFIEKATLDLLNGRIKAGTLKDCMGRDVKYELSLALVRKDKKLCYPIRDGIPLLMPEQGILL